MTNKPQTRQDIFQLWVDSGEATYWDWEIVFKVKYHSNHTVQLRLVKENNEYSLSIHDILFGDSNFFEAMFGEEEMTVWIVPYHSVARYQEKVCNYHKKLCVVAKDRLGYLIKALW